MRRLVVERRIAYRKLGRYVRFHPDDLGRIGGRPPHDYAQGGVMDKLLLTPKEATELLGISRSKLYELLRVGTIESVKIGDCRRVPRAALDEYVERLRREAVA
jgi:excisionase family DNA binding protein